MATAVRNTGMRPVYRDELFGITAPEPTRTYYPVPHGTVLALAERHITQAGYRIASERFDVSNGDHRFFGTLRLADELVPGVKLEIGLRNSTDRHYPMGIAAGTFVMVCGNGAFCGDLTYRRKHTLNGQTDFDKGIADAIGRVGTFRIDEADRIGRMRAAELTDMKAESIILRALESGILPDVTTLRATLAEWRKPSFADFADGPTAWRLFNAFTSPDALGRIAVTNPGRHATLTMRLMRHMAPLIGTDGAALQPVGTTLATIEDPDGPPIHLGLDEAEIIVLATSAAAKGLKPGPVFQPLD